jgi:hypothetical protein
MVPMNPSYEAAGGEGIGEFAKLIWWCFRLIASFFRDLNSGSLIGIAVGGISIVVVIVFLVRSVRRGRTAKRLAGNVDDS